MNSACPSPSVPLCQFIRTDVTCIRIRIVPIINQSIRPGATTLEKKVPPNCTSKPIESSTWFYDSFRIFPPVFAKTAFFVLNRFWQDFFCKYFRQMPLNTVANIIPIAGPIYLLDEKKIQ